MYPRSAAISSVKKATGSDFILGGATIASIFESFAFKEDDLIAIGGIAALVFLDTVTGMYRAYKDGRKLTSCGFSALFSKVVVYAIFVVTVHTLATVMFGRAGFDVVGKWIESTSLFAILLREA